MDDAEPSPEPEKKPVPLADWMAVWAEEDAREEARKKSGEAHEEDTQLLTPEQVFGLADDDDGQPVATLGGETAATPTPRPPDNFDAALDGEIRRLLERTAQYVKPRDASERETAIVIPGDVKAPLDFETPPGAWAATAPPLQFDDASSFEDETGGRLGLLDPIARPWHDPPTPMTIAPKRRPSNPPLAPFDPPSMTAPLQQPAGRKKPSNSPRPPESAVAPTPWLDPPPPARAAYDRSSTRRMRDTARRVAKSIAGAASEPAAPWLSLGIIGAAAAWIAVAFAAGNPLFALVGLGLLAPLAIAAAAAAAQRGAR